MKEIKDRIIRTEKLDWRKLKPFQPDNLKVMTEDSFKILKNSIVKKDFAASFKVWEENGEYWILDGHHRVKALESLDRDGYSIPTHFNCEILDCKDAKEANELLLIYSSSHAKIDEAGLFEFMTLNELDFDDMKASLEISGVDFDRMMANHGEEVTVSQEDEDDVPDLKIEATTNIGDIWILGNHRLMCGDSTHIDSIDSLMDGRQADMVFTDPPYGVDYQSNMRVKTKKFDVLKNDDVILDVAPIIFSILKDNAPAFIWTSHSVYPRWRNQFDGWYKNTIIWHKAAGGMGDLVGNYATDYEMALYCVKGKVEFKNGRGMAVWRIDKDSNASYEHPTQKPVALAEKSILDLTNSDELIVDLFGGSGSTLIACEKLNRQCYMMELSPAYCDVIINRWQKYSGKKATQAESGKSFDEMSPLV